MSALINRDEQRKGVDYAGREIVKGGQTVNESFFSGVTKAYTNLVNQPVVLIILIFLSMLFFEEYLEKKEGLFENIQAAFRSAAEKEKTNSFFARFYKSIADDLIQYLIKYKFKITLGGLALVPAMAKRSGKNMVTSGIICLFVLVATADREQAYLFNFYIITQLWLLFTLLRNPTHKWMISVLAVIIVVFWYDIGGHIVDEDAPTVVPAPTRAKFRSTTPSNPASSTTS